MKQDFVKPTIEMGKKSVTALKGLIRKPAKPVSVEAMNATIAALGASAK